MKTTFPRVAAGFSVGSVGFKESLCAVFGSYGSYEDRIPRKSTPSQDDRAINRPRFSSMHQLRDVVRCTWAEYSPLSHRMRIAAFLTCSWLAQVKTALTKEDRLDCEDSWARMGALLNSHSFDLILIDPAADLSPNLPALLALVDANPWVPFLVYISHKGSAIATIVELGNRNLTSMILAPFEGSRAQLREILTRTAELCIERAFMNSIAENLELLPCRTRNATIELFRHPARFAAAGDLALAAGTSRVSVYRAFSQAGFVSPKRALVVSRLLHVYGHFRLSRSLVRATIAAGYGGRGSFVRNTRQALDCRPMNLGEIPTLHFTAQLRTWLLRSPDASAPPDL
jgi:hypothetical protein